MRMLRDRAKRLFGQEEEDEYHRDQHFSDVTNVEMSVTQGIGRGATRIVTVTDGFGSSAKRTTLIDVAAIYFMPGKHAYITVHNRGTFVGMAGSKGVSGHFNAEERELRIGD